MLEDASQHYDPQRRRADAVVAAPAREPHVRHRLPAGAARVRADHRADARGGAAARPGQPAAAAHELRQLCRRRDHDALRQLPPRGRGASLRDRPAVRAVRRQCRAGRAPADDARPPRRASGVPFFMLRVDPAGNISKRYAGESFPFSHFGGTCPRWHLHARLPDAGPDDPPADRDSRRPALLHHQPDDRAADPARPARRRAAGDRARLRRQACARASLMPTGSTSPTRRRLRSARPARSARGCNAPIARRRRRGGCWRSRRTGSRFRLTRSCPARARPAPAPAPRGPISRGRPPAS